MIYAGTVDVGWPFLLEMTTAQRTRAVVYASRCAAWQLKFALRHSVSAAPRTTIFSTTIAGDFLFMNNNG